MSFFDSIGNMFSGGQADGYGDMMKQIQAAMDMAQRNAGQANALIDPFYQAGKGQLNPYMANYQRLLNPQQFYQDMMKGYETSPQAQRQLQMGTDAAMKAASASGMLGSTNLLNQVNENSQGIMRADQDNYYNKMNQSFNTGLGHQQGTVNMGYGAGVQQGNNLMNLSQLMAQLYGNMGQAQMGKSQADASGMGSFFGGLLGGFGGGGGLGGLMKGGGDIGSMAQLAMLFL